MTAPTSGIAIMMQVSDVIAEKLSASQKIEEGGKHSKAAATPLQDLFEVGQLVRCSIVALHDKDSSDGELCSSPYASDQCNTTSCMLRHLSCS